MQRLFYSFREASILSAIRKERDRERETPRSCLVCHDRPSRARIPPSPRALYSERAVGAEETASRNRERNRTRRRTVARVATSIRFSSSCGEVVKTFLLPPDWRRDAKDLFRESRILLLLSTCTVNMRDCSEAFKTQKREIIKRFRKRK